MAKYASVLFKSLFATLYLYEKYVKDVKHMTGLNSGLRFILCDFLSGMCDPDG